jgi:hypothetical protein
MQSSRDPTRKTMAHEHPFQMLFETLGRLPIAHADSVNRRAYETLFDILSVPLEKSGRCILLRAPRAGHGKTHLLARIQHHLGASHEFIPLQASYGCQIDASTVIDDALRRLLRPLPASGGLCMLDLVTRRLFAAALQPLVASGEVPCQDREGALTALRTRPIETFDFHHPNAVTAHWTRENFEVLGQRLSVELARRCDLPIREVAFWVEALFRFAATPVENPIRLRVLADAVHAGNPGGVVLTERLEALLGLLSLLMRVVLVADDLEGFSTDETAALRLAAFLGGLRQSVERLDVILSLNQDVWENAFVPKLSGGLADRLSEVVVELTPLTDDEMVALLESRVPGLGERVLARVDRAAAGTHARGLIRAAGIAWLKASAMDSQAAAPAAAAPVMIPPPAEVPVVFEPAPEVVPVLQPATIDPVSPPPFVPADPAPDPVPPPFVPPATVFTPSEPEAPVTWAAQESVGVPPPPAPESSPFQIPDPSPAAHGMVEAYAEPPPVPAPQDSPFVPAATPFEAPSAPEPVDPAPAAVFSVPQSPAFETPAAPVQAFQPAPTAPETPAPDTDRVDDLLRQFRERYGRGGS